MAAANVIASTTTAAISADVTVTATTVIALKSPNGLPGDALVSIQLKDDTGAYHQIAELSVARRSVALNPGVYRAVKNASGTSYGVFTG